MLGCPTKSSEQRIQKAVKTSRMWLRMQLLVFTKGVSLYFTNTPRTRAARAERHRDMKASVIPSGSSKPERRHVFAAVCALCWDTGHVDVSRHVFAAMCVLRVRILVIWTSHTLLHIC